MRQGFKTIAVVTFVGLVIGCDLELGRSCTAIGCVDDGTPERLRIVVARDEAPLIDSLHTLEYTANQPNGPGCAPICQQAQLKVRLP